MVKVGCPSCLKLEMSVNLEHDCSTCQNCGYDMPNLAFLKSLLGNIELVIEGGGSGNYYLYTKGISRIIRVGQVFCDDGVYRIAEIADLDMVLPFIENLKKLWPVFALQVVGGVSLNLQKCPVCGSDEMPQHDVYKVGCKGCENLSVDLTTFVFSRIAGGLHLADQFITVHRIGNKLDLSKTTTIKPRNLRTVRSLRELFDCCLEHLLGEQTNNEVVAKLQLREIRPNDGPISYLLAVEVAEGVANKPAFLDQIASCFDLESVKVKQVAKVL